MVERTASEHRSTPLSTLPVSDFHQVPAELKSGGLLRAYEAALLAGLAQGPSLYQPFRNPDRAKKRRNLILLMMRDNGFISPAEYQQAIEAPLGVKLSRVSWAG